MKSEKSATKLTPEKLQPSTDLKNKEQSPLSLTQNARKIGKT